MASTARYILIALGVLALAVALTACGNGVCGECAHACLARSDRADRLRKLVARLLTVGTVGGVDRTAGLAAEVRSSVLSFPPASLAAVEVSFLRI